MNKTLALATIFLLASFAAADGIIVPTPPVPRPPVIKPYLEPLSVKYHHVDATIDSQVAQTKVDQVFVNRYSQQMEGTYIFPLPEDATISNFAMYVDGERLDGKVMEKEEAKRTYEDIVRQLKDPALLEYISQNTFRARVYPIPARGEKKVELSYQQVLNCQDNVCRYRYPLKIEGATRYPMDVEVTVDVKSQTPIKSVYSPTHDIQVERLSDYEVHVSYSQKSQRPQNDFELVYTLSEKEIGVNLLTYKKDGEDGYYMMFISPKTDVDEGEVIPKDVTFVLDTSGSMSGEKIKQAKDALKFCINSLNKRDRFNLITFSSDVSSFSQAMLDNNGDNVQEALSYIDGIKADGGTNIDEALKTALALSRGGRSSQSIVFLTDGKPTVGLTDTEKIVQNTLDSNTGQRVFAFGVGYDVNTHLLDKLSDKNNGQSEYVKPSEDIEVKVSDFFKKISNPILSNIKVIVEGVKVSQVYPKKLPDIFKGSQLILFGRYNREGGSTVTLSGDVAGETREITYETYFRDLGENDYIPRLWATKKIAYLLDEIRLKGQNKELIDEVVSLSTRYGIMTPYTSFLVDMDEPVEDRHMYMEEAARYMTKSLNTLGMYEKSGANAVEGAQRLQSMKQADSAPAVEDEASAKIRYAGEKTFINKNGVWTDTQMGEETPVEVKYLSEAYLDIAQKDAEISKYLSVGEKVQFCTRGMCYKVTDEGTQEPADDLMPKTTAGGGKRPATTVGKPVTTTTGEDAGDEPMPESEGAMILLGFLVFALIVLAAGYEILTKLLGR